MILSLEFFPYLISFAVGCNCDRCPALAVDGHVLLALATASNYSVEGFMAILLRNILFLLISVQY